MFTPIYGIKRRLFCSDDCLHLTVKRAVRKKRGSDSHRARARRAGVEYEPVNRLAVFERDRWRCQVCGVRTPKRLMGKVHDRAPELDHRVPMAMGGGHVWSNVQCACRRCNAAKGGVRAVGQLPLFDRPEKPGGGSILPARGPAPAGAFHIQRREIGEKSG